MLLYPAMEAFFLMQNWILNSASKKPVLFNKEYLNIIAQKWKKNAETNASELSFASGTLQNNIYLPGHNIASECTYLCFV